MLYLRKGMPERAAVHAEASVGLHPQDDHAWRASSFALKGRCLAELSQFGAALEAIGQALRLHRNLTPPDELGEAETLISAARIHFRLGEFVLAEQRAQDALARYRYLGNRVGTAEALERISDVQHALGRHDEARAAMVEVQAILSDLG
jgi:tetratricopeptide (TPR) repeat protein